MFTIVIGGPILLVVGILLYNAELSYTARHCDAAAAGEVAAGACEMWLEHCRHEGDCDFASYWPPRVQKRLERNAELTQCLARASTVQQEWACMGWTPRS
jgi:hypothetical protein